eukprot:CAMPEP_0184013538 /NCGR_PEP_ID=MMETSP0954-20121128/5079_1 /TAXON_ID=627963 /ORGANISM="Aplanochytrium sp, Strain PBS07" /LENGTH=975 /DNA_ID=CAMNT_0026293759 /DNA_START=148 /DNA_END=3072 /DNA_ORIENTATION=-
MLRTLAFKRPSKVLVSSARSKTLRECSGVRGVTSPYTFGRLSKTGSFVPSTSQFASFSTNARPVWEPADYFEQRHVGPTHEETAKMLSALNLSSLDELIDKSVPAAIRSDDPEELKGLDWKGKSESEATEELRRMASKNKVNKSFIGQGYYGTKTPAVIFRNLLENPAWYTAYTPYQAEISQGRMEMLLNFQTVVSDITNMDIANCGLLDEGTSAAEAMNMSHAQNKSKRGKYFVSEDCFDQTVSCVETRAQALGIEIVKGDPLSLSEEDLKEYSGVLVQYPNKNGAVVDYGALGERANKAKAVFTVATDLLACSVLKPPGDFGADIVVGSAQRFGVPLFYGGPHAGFMSTKESLKRLMPGRLIGASIDSQGNRALRMALQTREQYIRREKATSNICTAQSLLANIAAAYAIYHGPDGLSEIARRVHGMAVIVKDALVKSGFTMVQDESFFDTIALKVPAGKSANQLGKDAAAAGLNIRIIDDETIGISVDESSTKADLDTLVKVLSGNSGSIDSDGYVEMDFGALSRTTKFLQHQVFNSHHSETQMMRYLTMLERKDITLRDSMIPLGSCTMKLNAASELMPVSWPEFANMHPFAPLDQAQGYMEMIESLNSWLASLTGFAAVSTQPNSGAAGEYAGLLCIKGYHEANGEGHRNVCLIPTSAHGTNPASAVLAGMKVVGVKNNAAGEVDIDDLRAKAEKHKDNLSAVMITYPSTYGAFEEKIKDLIQIVHDNGGQVYMDGANMNAQLGTCSPGGIGADVCHLNLHKTFAIPHGGGGPGVGSIGVARHLAPFLPGHSVVPVSGEGDNVQVKATGQVAAAPYGSAGILPISWMYIRMCGGEGLLRSSRTAILNANYMAKQLENYYNILFRNEHGMCAHEFIVDLRHLKEHGLSEDDVAKRLADYGFHAPTMSWPLHGAIMIEPTESESKAECDKLISALISIHGEIQDVIDGKVEAKASPLHNAPHTAAMVTASDW